MSMSCQPIGSETEGGPRKGRPGKSDWRAADLLTFAAAPTFAVMALVTAVGGGGPLDALCSAGPDASVLTGMVPMYVLMSAFHAAPWLRLIRSPSRLRLEAGRRPDGVRRGGRAGVEQVSRADG
jgi:hypothetical protein